MDWTVGETELGFWEDEGFCPLVVTILCLVVVTICAPSGCFVDDGEQRILYTYSSCGL